MKFLDLVVQESGKSMTLHVDESCKINTLIMTLKNNFGVGDKDALLYHVQSGRFFGGEFDIASSGIESGDDVMLIWRQNETNGM